MTSTRLDTFESALKEHSGGVLHYLVSLCNDFHIAQDLSQEVWKVVHRSFSEKDMLQKPLLYRKAKQVFIDYYRKTKCRADLYFTEEPPDTVVMPARHEPSDANEDYVLYQQFWEIFHPDEYDETSKRIFWLHERYGYTMEEVGLRLGMAKSTVNDKLNRLKKACRLRLENSTNSNL